MDARKLVGMSQRRRKEMFHAEFEAARNKDGTVSMFVADAFLSKYRIGQRLRPCPGEYQCKNCSQNNWCRCTDTEADAECVICGVLQHWPCDGSGVLTARAKKVMR